MVVVLWATSLAALVFVFVDHHFRDQRLFRDAENETQATWLAYGGIHKGLQKLSQDPHFCGPLPPEILNGGELRVQVLEKNGKTQIQSLGSFHGVILEAVKEVKNPENP